MPKRHTVRNQRPADLDPLWWASAQGPMDIAGAVREHVAAPLFEPIDPSLPVEVTGPQGPVDADAACELVIAAGNELADPEAEKKARQLLADTVRRYRATPWLTVGELYVDQALSKEGMEEPTPQVVYTTRTDVSPAARDYLAGRCGHDRFFASLACAKRPNCLGYSFDTAKEYEAFREWASGELAVMGPAVAPEAVAALKGPLAASLERPLEAFCLRDGGDDGNEPLSAARLLPALLGRYARDVSPERCHVLPFVLGELACPAAVVLVNVEEHAKASPQAVDREWAMLEAELRGPLRALTKGQLTNLMVEPRAVDYARSHSVEDRRDEDVRRHERRPFSATKPGPDLLTRLVRRVAKRMGDVARSSNTYKVRGRTFQRPSRRDPDDPNLAGRVDRRRYKPDIHVYLDCSGSITESMYSEAVQALIALAKKMDVDLYLNSFSTWVGPEEQVPLRRLSAAGAWRRVQAMDKVWGGTDFCCVHDYILASPKRRAELSVMLTDFEWSPPSHPRRHPRNLVYAPIATSEHEWPHLVRDAESFCEAMERHAPDIRSRVLF